MIEAIALLALLLAVSAEAERQKVPHKASREMSIEELDEVLAQAQIDGMSGHCAMAAIAINHSLLGGKATYVFATNPNIGDEIHPFVGHVAVRWGGILWDADGPIEDPEDLRSWGMVDPLDPDWEMWLQEAADPEEAAYEAELIDLEPTPENERMILESTAAHTHGSSVDEKKKQLEEARERIGWLDPVSTR
jgi:hypothetical protein